MSEYNLGMRIYIDLCAWKRPYDRPTMDRVVLEAMAVASILEAHEKGNVEIVSSTVLELENSKNPMDDRRDEVGDLLREISVTISFDDAVIRLGRELASIGMRPLDAFHVASAERAGCECFVTCDDKLLKAAPLASGKVRVRLIDPLEMVRILQGKGGT